MSTRERFFDESEASQREILTPEGVVLKVRLAEYADRAIAFVIDICFWVIALTFLYLGAALLGNFGLARSSLVPILLFLGTIVRLAYFLHFELAWQGATPGKRIVGLRVIDRRGGPLLAPAVIARNLTREFEIFLPLGAILSLGDAANGAASLLSLIWIIGIGALPFLNRDHMRGGDIIAGTIVIALPRRGLAPDLAGGDFHYTFTDRHLLAYGAFELQVLEELLRGAKGAEQEQILRAVGVRIRRKIGWTQEVPPGDELLFLKDFYAAERRFLEREQLFGRRRPTKSEVGQGTAQVSFDVTHKNDEKV